MSLSKVLERLRDQVTDFRGAAVVHRMEGTPIATVGEDATSGDPELGHAYLAELVKLHERAQESLGRTSVTEDMVVQTSLGLLLARPFDGHDYLWTLLVGPGANVTLTRAVMRSFHVDVAEALP